MATTTTTTTITMKNHNEEHGSPYSSSSSSNRRRRSFGFGRIALGVALCVFVQARFWLSIHSPTTTTTATATKVSTIETSMSLPLTTITMTTATMKSSALPLSSSSHDIARSSTSSSLAYTDATEDVHNNHNHNNTNTVLVDWYKPYIQNLTRTWNKRTVGSWCQQPETRTPPHFLWWVPTTKKERQQGPKTPVPGMIYIKLHKASSSTCEGIALNIAHRVGRRLFGNGGDGRGKSASNISTTTTSTTTTTTTTTTESLRADTPSCIAHTRHEFADRKQHMWVSNTSSLLWSFVRRPAARDLSHVLHFQVAREGNFILATGGGGGDRNDNNNSSSSSTKKNNTNHETRYDAFGIQHHIEMYVKGRQTRYLVPRKTSKAKLWPRHEIRKGVKSRKVIVEHMQKFIFQYYDFLGVVERMSESLAVMVELWGLEVEDVIVLSSKRSGGYDDGGGGNQCVTIPKPQVTPELQTYFEGRHAMWNADILLYQAAVESLDATIDEIGRDKIQTTAARIEELQRLAHEKCLAEAVFPCSPTGEFQPQRAAESCYVQDAGCGHECVDRILAVAKHNVSKGQNTTSAKLTTATLPTIPNASEHCQQLVRRHGFWDQRQCDLWEDVIEGNKSIDMTPYLATNISEKDRWWPSTMHLHPPGSLTVTVPAGRGTGATIATQPRTNATARGRLIYHLHIHKSGGTFWCKVFQKAKLKREFVQIVDDSGNIDNSTADNDLAVARALARIQLTNPRNNCNAPDYLWKYIMNQTMSDYKRLLKTTLSDADTSPQQAAAFAQLQKQALDVAQEYARPYPGGLAGMSHIHTQLERSGWYQFAPYLGDTRSTMRDIYKRITGIGMNDKPVKSRRPTVPHNLRWIFVANEGSLELEPIFGADGPYFYSILLRDPISWAMSMFRYEMHVRDDLPADISLEHYLQQHLWGGPQFMTRRVCGLRCIFEGYKERDPTREHFLRAKSFLDHFDMVWTLEETNVLLKEGELGRIFPSLQFEHGRGANRTTSVDGDRDGIDTKETQQQQQQQRQRPRRRLQPLARSSKPRSGTIIRTTLKQTPKNDKSAGSGTDNATAYKAYKQAKSTSEIRVQPRPPKPNLTLAELDLIRNYAWMDKVLYEYGKMLMQRKHGLGTNASAK